MMASKNAHFNYAAVSGEEPDDFFRVRKEPLVRILRYLHDHPEVIETEKPKKAAASYETLRDDFGIIEGSWNDSPGDIENALKRLTDLRMIPEFDPTILGPGWDRLFERHVGRGSWIEFIQDENKDPLLLQAIKNYR